MTKRFKLFNKRKSCLRRFCLFVCLLVILDSLYLLLLLVSSKLFPLRHRFLQMSETILIFAIVLTFSALILTVVWLLKASGLFTSIRIKVTKPSFDDLTILYKFQQGDYSQSADIFRDILNYSPSHRTLGIYYDKPADVSEENTDRNRRFRFFSLSKQIDASG